MPSRINATLTPENQSSALAGIDTVTSLESQAFL